MDLAQRERVAIGFAIIVHLLLFALLSLTWGADEEEIDNPPMAVDLIAEVAPVSTAPTPATEEPAARRGEIDSDAVEPVPAPPLPRPIPRVVEPQPAPKRADPVRQRRPDPQTERRQPQSRPDTRSDRRPAQPPARDSSERRRPDRPASTTPRRADPAATRQPTRPARDTRPAGNPLGDIADSVARDSARNARGTNAPAAQTAAEVRQSIQTSISAEVRAPWNSGRCRLSGIDMERLNTTVIFNLTQTGGLERIVSVSTSGMTESNRPQVALFEECARRAIEQAAPFNLPAEHYDYWRRYELDFNKR